VNLLLSQQLRLRLHRRHLLCLRLNLMQMSAEAGRHFSEGAILPAQRGKRLPGKGRWQQSMEREMARMATLGRRR
jgi:hypothetical protein